MALWWVGAAVAVALVALILLVRPSSSSSSCVWKDILPAAF